MKCKPVFLLWLLLFLLKSIPGITAAEKDSIQIVDVWKQSMRLSDTENTQRDALLNRAVQMAKQFKQYTLLIKLYHWKAILKRNNYDYEKALPLADSALQVAENNALLQTQACRDAIAFYIVARGEFVDDSSTLKWIYKGKELCSATADWFNYSICLTLEAVLQRDRYTIPQILALYDSAQYYAAQTTTVHDDVLAIYNQSYFLKMQGKKDWVASLAMLLSLKQYFNASEWALPLHEPWKRIAFRFRDPRSATYRQIAAAYLVLLDFNNAYQYQKMIVEQRKEEHNLKNLFFAYADLGVYAIFLENKTLVQSIYDTCVVLAKQAHLDATMFTPSFLAMQGWLKEVSGHVAAAIPLYQRACYIEGKDFSFTEFYLLRSFVKQKQYASADSLIQVLQYQQQSSFVYFPQALFSKELAFYYQQTNQPDSALWHLLKYYQLKDSLLQAAHYIQLKEIDTKYQTEEKDRQIAAAAQIKKYQDLQLIEAQKMNRLMLIVVIALLAIVLLVGYVWQQKRKQAYVLAQKNNKIELLIRELHHRVKNNLQIVSGILSLHANRMQNNSAKEALEEGKARVNAIALLHQRLYMDDDVANVNMEEYLQNLSISLANSFGYDLAHVQTNVKLSTNRMSIDKAIPIGLIINELVTNAFKHAFTNTIHPLVTIELQMIKQHTLQLKVSDNGVGMPNMADMEKNTSFGMRMVQTLVQQLDAQLNFSSHNGTQFVIEMNNI